MVGQRSIDVLKTIEKDVDTVFYAHDELGGGMTSLSWIKFINKRLKKYALIYNCNANIKSHSFRIGYVTQLLKNLPLHQVTDLISHANVSTTMKYNRYELSDRERANATDLLFN